MVEAALMTAAKREVPSAPPMAVLDATRALLWITAPSDVAAIALDLVLALGGTTMSASDASEEQISIDISFGVGEPVLPSAPVGSAARVLLDSYLPAFMEDALRVLDLTGITFLPSKSAPVDALRGLLSPQLMREALCHLGPQDIVIVIDFDRFKVVNETHGQLVSDLIMKAMGKALGSTMRNADQAGHLGGDRFVVVLAGGQAVGFLARVRDEWTRNRPRAVTFSAGIAPARISPAHALQAAERAMSRAKQAGRDQWQAATPEDYR